MQEEDETSPVFLFEMSVDALFMLDIIFNFFTAYTDPTTGLTVSSPKKIATKYVHVLLKSYFTKRSQLLIISDHLFFSFF